MLGRSFFICFIDPAEYQCEGRPSTDRYRFVFSLSVIEPHLLRNLEDLLLVGYQLLVVVLSPDV